jgi:hypothetical protein
MRFMTTLILALLLVGILVIIQFYGENTPKEEEENTPLFPGLVISTVDRIELFMYAGRTALLEKREGNRWWMTKPFQEGVRSDLVKNILEGLRVNLRHPLALGAEERNLSAKGLDPYQYYIRFHDARGEHTLYVGARDPFKNETYVMIEGDDQLYRTGSNLLNILEMNPENLRDDRVLRIDPLLVNEVFIERPEGVVLHAVKKSAFWEIVGPFRVDSESGRIQNLISRLAGLKVQGHLHYGAVDDAVRSRFGLQEPLLKITLKAGSVARTVEMETTGVGPAGDYIGVRDGEDAVISVARPDLDRISFKLNTYRSRSILKPLRELIQNLKVWREGTLALELQRVPNERYFNIAAPFKARANNISDGNQTPVYGFLTQVDGIKIMEFAADGVEDLGPYQLDSPHLTLDFLWREGGVPRKAKVVFSEAPASGEAFAARVDRPAPYAVYKVKASELEPLYRDALYLRDPRVFPQDVKRIKGATFTYGGKRHTIRRNENDFFTHDPASRFQQFLNEMTRTTVVRYEAGPSDANDPRFETAIGTIRLEVLERGKVVESLFELGKPWDGGWWGRISSLPMGTFVLDQEFMTAFQALFKGL